MGFRYILVHCIKPSIQNSPPKKKVKFENSHCEDYDFLNLVKKYNYLILIINTIKYFVKSNYIDYKEEQLEYSKNYKVFINGINPFGLLNFFSNI